MTNACRRRKGPLPCSKPNRCAAILKSHDSTKRAGSGTARWFITTKCCNWIQTRLTPRPRASALKPSNRAFKRQPPIEMRLPEIFAVSAVAALLAGCAGYHLGPVNGAVAGEKSVEVLPFNNQTLQPRLGDAVTQALRERLQTDGT